MMTTKSHVSMETHVCVVCATEYNTDAILLDRRVRQVLDPTTCTGWGMCPEHEAMKDDGYIALVEANTPPTGETLTPGDADRTGQICHVRESVWGKIFNIPVPSKGVCFVEPGVIEYLEAIPTEKE